MSMIPKHIQNHLDKLGFKELRPSQEKSIKAGLFKGKNLLVCTPTASGKTLVGELGLINRVLGEEGKRTGAMGVYVVPLRALASEKYKEFSKKHPKLKIALTSGDMDSDDRYLAAYDIIITTSEKFDSLIRHHTPWLEKVEVVVIDEIHLLNDLSRGPTLEILITILRDQNPKLQLIGLSATIGNAKELAAWLDAKLVEDTWRPVKLRKGIYFDGSIHFPNENAK
ncbi:DEAD/DEAH box helicase [Candidatus Woesearchaeota archaeon]|nr:DEAD/DEAH box helicase [Candidatus Woesearchaeota archaeon]